MWRELGADGIRRSNRGDCYCRAVLLAYLVLTNVTGLLGFMMDMDPSTWRCVTELLVERKGWLHMLPTEFVVHAMSLDNHERGKLDTVPFKVKGVGKSLSNRLPLLYSYDLVLDGKKKTVDFQYHDYHEVSFCFHNPTKRTIRVLLDFKFVPLEQAASLIRESDLQRLEGVIENIESVGMYIAAQLDDFSQSEHRLSKTSSMLWTCQLICAVSTIIILIGLGIWQLSALRNFFKNKKLV